MCFEKGLQTFINLTLKCALFKVLKNKMHFFENQALNTFYPITVK